MNIHNFPLPYSPAEFKGKIKGIRDKPENFTSRIYELFNISLNMFKWDIPEKSIQPEILEFYLQCFGWACLIKKNNNFLIVSENSASFSGEKDAYFMPMGVIVANPYTPDFNGEYNFSENCILIKNDYMMQGLYKKFSRAVEMLVENDITIINALENLRLMNVFHATDNNTAHGFEVMLNNLKNGKLSTIIQSENDWMSDSTPIDVMPVNGVCTTYMQQLIEIATFIKGNLLNEIGLQSNWNMKRQALSANEIGANDSILKPLPENMLECRERFAKTVGWKVEFSETWKEVKNDINGGIQGDPGNLFTDGGGIVGGGVGNNKASG